MSIEDILLYADDLLLLCQTPGQMKKCIQIVEEWSRKNGMELNKKKSGIVVFAPRSAKTIPYMILEKKPIKGKDGKIHLQKKWVSACKEIAGISVVSSYKYLGTYLDPKLTMELQIDTIRKKSDFLFTRLYPYLINATADGRKDMWRTMVCLLFNGILALLEFEPSESHYLSMLKLWHGTFKMFLMIPKSTNTEIVDEMIGIDLDELKYLNTQNSARKWFARWSRKEPELLPRKESKNYLKGIPNDWCSIVKQECGLCKLCKNSTRNPIHMELVHKIEVFPYKEIWEMIKEFHDSETEKQKQKNKIMKTKREIFLKRWKIILHRVKETIQERLDLLYSKRV